MNAAIAALIAMAPTLAQLGEQLLAEFEAGEQTSADTLKALNDAEAQAAAAFTQVRAAMTSRDAATEKVLDDAEAALEQATAPAVAK